MPWGHDLQSGITRSLTLADVLSRELDGYTDPEIQKLRIKISGCPIPADIITLPISVFTGT